MLIGDNSDESERLRLHCWQFGNLFYDVICFYKCLKLKSFFFVVSTFTSRDGATLANMYLKLSKIVQQEKESNVEIVNVECNDQTQVVSDL
jgi:hypothetical protein